MIPMVARRILLVLPLLAGLLSPARAGEQELPVADSGPIEAVDDGAAEPATPVEPPTPAHTVGEDPSGEAVVEDPPDAVSGRIPQPDGGFVRFVLSVRRSTDPDALPYWDVRLENLSSTPFELRKRDRWMVVTDSGKTLEGTLEAPLGEPGLERKRVILPGEALSAQLDAPGDSVGRLVSLKYRSSSSGRELVAATPYRSSRLLESRPPVYPESLLGGARYNSTSIVRTHILSDSSGEITGLKVDPGASVPPPAVENVREAVRHWIFEPASEAGVSVESFNRELFRFSDEVVIRTDVPMPLHELVAHIWTMMGKRSPYIVPVPGANGLAVADRPVSPEAYRKSVMVHLVRWGAGSEEGSSWVAVRSLEIVHRGANVETDCSEWKEAATEGRSFVSGLVSAAGLPPVPPVTYAPQGGMEIPSGDPEPASLGDWNDEAIDSLARASAYDLASGALSGAESPSLPGSGLPSVVELPDDFDPRAPVRTPRPDFEPPELLRKVAPEYPVEASDAGIGGGVILHARMDARGNVRNVHVLRSIPALDDAAVDAVCNWKYKPARIHGVAVPVSFTVIVEFKLK